VHQARKRKKAKPAIESRIWPFIFRGVGRIRTAVDGFAIRCLATRPQRQLFGASHQTCWTSQPRRFSWPKFLDFNSSTSMSGKGSRKQKPKSPALRREMLIRVAPAASVDEVIPHNLNGQGDREIRVICGISQGFHPAAAPQLLTSAGESAHPANPTQY
jgi:hypothetical protein